MYSFCTHNLSSGIDGSMYESGTCNWLARRQVKIFFVNEALARSCNDDAVRERRFGTPVAQVLRRRLAQIDAAEHLAELRHIPAIRLRAFADDKLTVALGATADLQMRPRDDPPPRLEDCSLYEHAVRTLLITDVLLAPAT